MWRETKRTPKIAWIDASAFIPVFVMLVHIRLWTFEVSLVSVAFFTVLAKFGLTPAVLYRKIRHKICGRVRYARPWWYWKRFGLPKY